MSNISDIHDWNEEANLLHSESRKLESTMLLEEIFEGLGIPDPKSESRSFVQSVLSRADLVPVSDVEWLDHLCDIEFILHGSKAKMGLTPQLDSDSLFIVVTANKQKLSAGQDEHGKQIKPYDFTEPNKALSDLLDSI